MYKTSKENVDMQEMPRTWMTSRKNWLFQEFTVIFQEFFPTLTIFP